MTDERMEFYFLLRNSFMSFVEFCFGELYPQTRFHDSPHLSILAAKLEECTVGKCKRLIVCLPPRSLKSLMVSAAWPAWLLGRNPHLQIICASYGQGLAEKNARDTRTLMSNSTYQQVFPTRISKQKCSVDEFMTTKGGLRMATSVGGSLTGRGGEILIVDDSLKPADADSETMRKGVNEWYDGTVLSRLNNKQEGVIVIVMQRVHQDDLVGHLLEREPDQWEVIRFPAIAEEDEVHTAETEFGPIEYRRKAGEVLDPKRETMESLQQLRISMGEYHFQSQYQQNPGPEGGAMIKKDWLRYYTPEEKPAHFSTIIQSWDTANKSGELNDYSVCVTMGLSKGKHYLLDVFRKRLEYPDLRRAAKEMYKRFEPHTVVIEDHGSGIQLLADLRRDGILRVKPYRPLSGQDKKMRLFAQSSVFESGGVILPTEASWLTDYRWELLTFPGSKHDDQVDATTQALEYLRTHGKADMWARLGAVPGDPDYMP